MLSVAFGYIDQWTLESPSAGLKVRRHKLCSTYVMIQDKPNDCLLLSTLIKYMNQRIRTQYNIIEEQTLK
jgi:hypothetical protein